MIGANRIGKSTAGAAEVVSVLRGYNPWRGIKYELPTHVWAVPLDSSKLGSVLKRHIRKFLPRDGYREWINDGIFKLHKKHGGSELRIMACEAGPEKFQGAELDFCHLDEEPYPRGDEIFNEIYARVSPGRLLDIILTYTPLRGYTWSYKRFIDEFDEDYLRGPDGEKIVEVFSYSLRQFHKEAGGHLSEAEIQRLEAAYPKHERKARVMGQYSLVSGEPFHDPELVDKARERAEADPRGEHKRIWIDGMKQCHVEKTDDASWLFIRERIPYARYVIGVDVASGSQKDRTVATCVKLPDEKSPAHIACRWRSSEIIPTTAAKTIVYPMARYYNRAEVINEKNGEWGGAFLVALQEVWDIIWNNLKWDRQKNKMTGEIGWRTTGPSRGILHSLVQRALEDELDVFTTTCCDEISTVIEEKKTKRIDHAYGMKDDEYFSLALALFPVYNEPPVVRAKPEDVAEMYTYAHPWQRGMR